MNPVKIVIAVLRALIDPITDLVASPPKPHEEEERAKQIGMTAIRAASDAQAKAEIGGES